MSEQELYSSKIEEVSVLIKSIKKIDHISNIGLGAILPIILVIAWQVLSNIGVFPAYLFPSPSAVINTLVDLFKEGELIGHVEITAYRVLAGFVVGSIGAIVLGAVTGYYNVVYKIFDPLIQALRAIPSLSWVPLFILWLGIGEESKVTLIAVGVFFPVYLNWVMGIKGVDQKYVEVGKLYHFTTIKIIKQILLPAALPSLLTGLRSGLGLGWMFVVAAELMGSSKGLGYLMVFGQNNSTPELIVGSILLFAILGKITDGVLIYIERRVLHWQSSFGREDKNVSA
ncbi:ABC transporter permease subunit [Clostridium bovifaecis]|uniref:ABC transporter permease subunit n=1 Tax=Clostridium bovifaecis TaxID=2184719 RepID=A0A6I6EKY6_9CLOT|nr:ABC transporter permease subunit [Clostridium bovifaecis]